MRALTDIVAATPATQPSPAGVRFERLDVLRAWAILAVFLFHSLGTVFQTDQLPWTATAPDFAAASHPAFLVFYGYALGPLGVTLFFVISGFCIHWSYLRWLNEPRRTSAANTREFIGLFYWKRLWRIYPPYLVALLVWALLRGYDFTSLHDLKQITVHALLLHNFDEGHFFAVHGVFWSLAVEMQLYAIYPLVIFAHRRFKLAAIIGLLVASVALKESNVLGLIENARLKFAIGQLPIFYWPQWLAGALAAEFVSRRIVPGRVWAVAVFVAGCLYLPASQHLMFRDAATYLVFGVFAVAVWIAASDQRPLGPFERILVPIGMCSYSLYMYHTLAVYPFLLIASPKPEWSPWWELTYGSLLGLIVTLGISWLAYVWIEKTSEKTGAILLSRLRATHKAVRAT